MSKQKELIPKERFINGDSPAKIPNWRLIDSPERPDCVEREEGIEIYTTKNNVKYVRTPEERFENLKDFPYEPHYALVEDLRMHYIDEGSERGEIILMLHGQPSWSYLYRKMIPLLAKENYRVIAADHIGMGRSDKPIDLGFHTYEHHVAILKKFITALKLENITLFGQDWGGVMGIRVVGDQPESFARVIAANTDFPFIIPKGLNPFLIPNPVKIDCFLKEVEFGQFVSEQMSQRKGYSQSRFMKFFQRWIIFCLTHPNFEPSKMLQFATRNNLSIEELAGYDAPYPSLIYKAAPRTFPSMLAAIEQNNVEAWKNLSNFDNPFLFLGGEKDPSFGSLETQKGFTDHIPGTKGQAHQRYANAAHFIQDDIGIEMANKVISFIETNQLKS
jgi:haloalkane dehalogenase